MAPRKFTDREFQFLEKVVSTPKVMSSLPKEAQSKLTDIYKGTDRETMTYYPVNPETQPWYAELPTWMTPLTQEDYDPRERTFFGGVEKGLRAVSGGLRQASEEPGTVGPFFEGLKAGWERPGETPTSIEESAQRIATKASKPIITSDEDQEKLAQRYKAIQTINKLNPITALAGKIPGVKSVQDTLAAAAAEATVDPVGVAKNYIGAIPGLAANVGKDVAFDPWTYLTLGAAPALKMAGKSAVASKMAFKYPKVAQALTNVGRAGKAVAKADVMASPPVVGFGRDVGRLYRATNTAKVSTAANKILNAAKTQLGDAPTASKLAPKGQQVMFPFADDVAYKQWLRNRQGLNRFIPDDTAARQVPLHPPAEGKAAARALEYPKRFKGVPKKGKPIDTEKARRAAWVAEQNRQAAALRAKQAGAVPEAPAAFGLDDLQKGVTKPTVVGSKPKTGLVVANKGADGNIYVGKKGDLHFNLSDRYSDTIRKNAGLKPGDATWTEVGFMDDAGNFLTREEALKKTSVKPSIKGELDASDYREQELSWDISQGFKDKPKKVFEGFEEVGPLKKRAAASSDDVVPTPVEDVKYMPKPKDGVKFKSKVDVDTNPDVLRPTAEDFTKMGKEAINPYNDEAMTLVQRVGAKETDDLLRGTAKKNQLVGVVEEDGRVTVYDPQGTLSKGEVIQEGGNILGRATGIDWELEGPLVFGSRKEAVDVFSNVKGKYLKMYDVDDIASKAGLKRQIPPEESSLLKRLRNTSGTLDMSNEQFDAALATVYDQVEDLARKSGKSVMEFARTAKDTDGTPLFTEHMLSRLNTLSTAKTYMTDIADTAKEKLQRVEQKAAGKKAGSKLYNDALKEEFGVQYSKSQLSPEELGVLQDVIEKGVYSGKKLPAITDKEILKAADELKSYHIIEHIIKNPKRYAAEFANLKREPLKMLKELEEISAVADLDAIASSMKSMVSEFAATQMNVDKVASASARVLRFQNATLNFTRDAFQGAASSFKKNIAKNRFLSKVQQKELAAKMDAYIDVIPKVAGTTDPSALYNLMNQWNAADRAFFYWINNILSSPKTHGWNLSSNAAQLFLKYADTLGAVGTDVVRSKLTGADRTVSAMELIGYMRGTKVMAKHLAQANKSAAEIMQLGGGLSKSFNPKTMYKNLKKYWRIRNNVFAKEFEKIREFDIADRMYYLSQAERNPFLNPGASTPTKAFGKTFGIPTAALGYEDNSFKAIVGYMEKYGLQERLKASMKRGSKLKFNLTADQVKDRIYDEQLYRTFQRNIRLMGKNLTDAVQNTRQGVPGARYIMPFVNVWMNIFTQGMTRSPLQFFNMIGKRVVDKNYFRSEQFAVDTARLAQGMFIGGWALKKYMEGRLTPDAPLNRKERETFYAKHPPNSIKVGDAWVPLSRLEPFSTPITLSVNAANDYIRAMEDPDIGNRPEAIFDAIWKLPYHQLDKTFMKGVKQFTDAVLTAEQYDRRKAMATVAGGFHPFSGALRFVTQETDPYYRRPETFMDMMKEQFPYSSQSLPEARGPLGEPKKRATGFLGIQRPEDKPLAQLYEKIDVDVPLTSGRIGEDKLTKREVSEIKRRSAVPIIKTIMKAVSKKEWDSLDPVLKEEIVGAIVTGIHSVERERLKQKKRREGDPLFGEGKYKDLFKRAIESGNTPQTSQPRKLKYPQQTPIPGL